VLSFLVAVIFATSTAGCLARPPIECDLSATLTQAECDHAAEAALAKLPSDSVVTVILVHAGCPYFWRCGAMNVDVIGVEISFAHTTTRALFAVDRRTGDPGPPNYTSAAPPSS
jgi:hypothetical protein